MIRRGRTRRGGPPGLDWHETLGARRRRSVAGLRAAWAALAAAVVGMLLILMGMPAWSQPALVAVAALAAGAWPVRDAHDWAKRWISSERGLGYATALEARERDDPFGLWAASRERALLDLRDARAPASSSWWLPPLVACILLLAVPYLATLSPGSPFGARAPSSGPAAEGDGAADGEATGGREADVARGDEPGAEGGPAGEPEPPPPAAAGEEPPEEAGAETDPQGDGDGEPGEAGEAGEAGDGGEGGGEGAAGREAVDRYLRELEERRAADSRNPFDPVPEPPESRGGDESSPGGGEMRSGGAEGDPSDPGTSTAGDDPTLQEARPEGRPEGGAEGARSEGTNDAGSEGGEAAEGASEEASEGQGEPASTGAEGETAPGEEGEEGEPAGGGEGESDAAEGAEQGEGAPDPGGRDEGLSPEAGAEAGATEGDEGSPGAAAGERQEAGEPGDRGGEGAGADPGTEAPAEALPGEPGGRPEHLGGPLGEGETPVVGSTREGGRAPDAVPEGAPAPDRYVRDAERAVEETGVPSAYREIIRRYFR